MRINKFIFQIIKSLSFLETLYVIINITIEELNFLVINNIDSITDSTDEILIMGDNNQSTFITVKSINKSIDSIEIQMIGRLIQ